jgi:hypothetical protein
MTRQPWHDWWMRVRSVVNSALKTSDNGSRSGVAFISQHSGCRVLPVALVGTTDLWRSKTLRVRIAPLDALPLGANRHEEQIFVDGLRTALHDALPPQPAEPPDGKKPWRWLTQAL